MRVLGIDLGKNLGFGLVADRGRPVSGSHEICAKWTPLGPNLLKLEDRLHRLIVEHKPDRLATATQFINLRRASTDNLIPIYAGFGVLNMLAAALGLPLDFTSEGKARESFLGVGMVPRKSDDAKAAVHQSCRDRNWRCPDWDASDALCIASWGWERASKGRGYETTPLFQAAPTMRQRRRAA